MPFVMAYYMCTERREKYMFAERLKYLRTHYKGRKLTQEEMSKLLKIQRSTYGEYERGKITPPMDKINFLSNYFGVSVDYLLGNTNLITPDEGETDEISDVSVSIRRMIEELENDQNNIVFEGETLDKETRKLLISSLQNSINTGRLIKKVQNDSKRTGGETRDE